MKKHFEPPKLKVFGIESRGGVICASANGEFSSFSYEAVSEEEGFKTVEE